mgnify:CR=1 FL=1
MYVSFFLCRLKKRREKNVNIMISIFIFLGTWLVIILSPEGNVSFASIQILIAIEDDSDQLILYSHLDFKVT